jgi:hypothetical protein
MVTEKLIINGVDIPLINGIGTVLNYSIKDIEQPDKRKASFSKTIKLPQSKVTSDLFNFIFEINSDSTFNPNLKADAIYLINDIAVFKGIIQLKKVNKLDNEHYTYDVILLGELANIFTEFGDDYVDALDMNWFELDHQYTIQRIAESWATSYQLNGTTVPFVKGDGYVWPMINYGKDANDFAWLVEDFRPAAFAKEYIDRMFSAAGFEYDSTFFNSQYFRSLIIPFSGKEFTFSSSNLNNLNVITNTPLYDSTGTDTSTTEGTYELIRNTVEVSDIDNQYNPANGKFTVASGNDSTYEITGYIDVLVSALSGLAATSDMISTLQVTLSVFVNNTEVDQVKGFRRIDPSISFPTTAYSFTLNQEHLNQIVNLADLPDSQYTNINTPIDRIRIETTQNLYSGDEVTLKVKAEFIPDAGETNNFVDGAGNESTGSLSVELDSTSVFAVVPLSNTYLGQNTIEFRNSIPKKVKKRDFFKAIVEMFNLYIEPDLDNPKKLYIEPREDYYVADVVDWSSKLDVSKDIKYDMLASKNKSRYNYSYKSDSDYYNKLYEDTWQKVYANREIDIDNDFNNDSYSQNVMFSPTTSVGDIVHDRIIPTIIGVDKDLQPVRTNANIRILYYGGMKSTNQSWNLRIVNSLGTVLSSVSYTTYPYSGMWDDPYSPTEDIGFGLPKEIYYDSTFGTITVSNNNLYNKYHRKELEEQTDKDSRLVTGYFLLNPTDIYNLDFKKQYFFDNAYFRLQEVKYIPNSYEVSECKFLKLKTAQTFTATTKPLVGGYTEDIGDEKMPASSYKIMSNNNILTEKSANVKGFGNNINRTSRYVDIVGDNNKVSSNCVNINIQGNNNLVESNLKNVTLINTSNTTVTESNVTYVNGEIRGAGSVVSITADTTATEEVKLYLCDASGGNIDVTLPTNPTQGKTWNFKKVGSSNTVRVKSSAPVLIDGSDTTSLTANHKSVVVQFDGINYKIIE